MISSLQVTVSLYLISTRIVLSGLPTLRMLSLLSWLFYSPGLTRSNDKRRCVTAELRSIFVGLQLVWSMGISRLQVQSDSSIVVHLVLDPMAATSSSPLVRVISLFSNRNWSIVFTWVPRE
ncbi:hypothetical protein V6N11_043013 [Hibiscus sabdariffa]|uniref:RNase H type-1 domain-containing protein n=1 Tax=Hibiscus sabdariffa TaxID=183260 RepID=A0ABR2QYF8_9ROSI